MFCTLTRRKDEYLVLSKKKKLEFSECLTVSIYYAMFYDRSLAQRMLDCFVAQLHSLFYSHIGAVITLYYIQCSIGFLSDRKGLSLEECTAWINLVQLHACWIGASNKYRCCLRSYCVYCVTMQECSNMFCK